MPHLLACCSQQTGKSLSQWHITFLTIRFETMTTSTNPSCHLQSESLMTTQTVKRYSTALLKSSPAAGLNVLRCNVLVEPPGSTPALCFTNIAPVISSSPMQRPRFCIVSTKHDVHPMSRQTQRLRSPTQMRQNILRTHASLRFVHRAKCTDRPRQTVGLHRKDAPHAD